MEPRLPPIPAAMVEYRLPHRTAISGGMERRRLRPARVLAAGFIAGTLVLVLLVAASVAVYDEPAGHVPRLMAALAWGDGALRADSPFDAYAVGGGIALHYALALLYALALATIVKDVPRRLGPWIGLAFGSALYFVNLHGFTQLFPWFAPLRTADTLLAHALFGLVAARAYLEV